MVGPLLLAESPGALHEGSMETKSLTVGILGTGAMGSAMAMRLLEKGRSVVVYNRSVEAARALVSHGASLAANPADVLEADVVLSLLFNDEAVRSTLDQSGLLAPGAAPRRRLHVCCSTISPGLSRELAAAHERAGAGYVAAPVFGRPDAARAGGLQLVVAGQSEAVAIATPVLRDLGTVWPMGETPAHAHAAKIAGNFMIAGSLEAMAEATALLSWEGAAPASFVDFVTRTLFAAPIYQRYASAFGDGAAPPLPSGLALPLKDLALVERVAREAGGSLPIASLIRERLSRAREAGLEDEDWSVALASAARHRHKPGADSIDSGLGD